MEVGLSSMAEMTARRVLVTGANGFVGRELSAVLLERGFDVVPAVRQGTAAGAVVGEINASTEWTVALQGVDVVVHLAARVHVMDELAVSAEPEFERVNVRGSERLARQAAAAGVKRLVFVSSIKVNGEATYGTPFRADDMPHPEDAYGRSKLAAEVALKRISLETGLEIVIVRPPMVIGPDTKGNLPVMMRWLQLGVPLPLAGVRNRRSFVSVRNLVGLIECCIVHPAAAGEVFLAADEPALSTPDLIAALAAGLGRKVNLWRMPLPLLRVLACVAGRSAQLGRLTGDLEVDASKARQLLGWHSDETLNSALLRTAKRFLDVSEQLA
jgi:nucleoside-diphosphate-sugar epimerase